MTELFEEDELIEEEMLSMEHVVNDVPEKNFAEARRRWENMLATQQLNRELDDLADYL